MIDPPQGIRGLMLKHLLEQPPPYSSFWPVLTGLLLVWILVCWGTYEVIDGLAQMAQ